MIAPVIVSAVRNDVATTCTLMDELRRRGGLRRAPMCAGGGMGGAVSIEV